MPPINPPFFASVHQTTLLDGNQHDTQFKRPPLGRKLTVQIVNEGGALVVVSLSQTDSFDPGQTINLLPGATETMDWFPSDLAQFIFFTATNNFSVYMWTDD